MDDKALLSNAVMASICAGAEIMAIYTDPNQDFGIERKADNSPLTLADKAAHKTIVEMLSGTEIPILSEEGAQMDYTERSKWERYWLVDPLDGTKEFIKKNGEFTVNIALIEKGVPVLGVVYLPAKDVLYCASASTRACKMVDAAKTIFERLENDETTFDLQMETLPLESAKHDDYVIVASRSHLSPETQAFIDEVEKKYDKVRTISSGSSIKICLVAEGSADAYPRYAPTMEWDTAAGDAIARMAGKMCYQAGSEEAPVADPSEPLVYNKEDMHNPWFLVK